MIGRERSGNADGVCRVQNVSQTPELGLLMSENTKLAGERNSAIKSLESEKKRTLKMVRRGCVCERGEVQKQCVCVCVCVRTHKE